MYTKVKHKKLILASLINNGLGTYLGTVKRQNPEILLSKCNFVKITKTTYTIVGCRHVVSGKSCSRMKVVCPDWIDDLLKRQVFTVGLFDLFIFRNKSSLVCLQCIVILDRSNFDMSLIIVIRDRTSGQSVRD